MTRETRHFYLCPPVHFQVDYAINAWTCPSNRVDARRAMEQWERLCDVYVEAGAEVSTQP